MESSLSIWVWMVLAAILLIVAAGIFYLLRGLVSNLLLLTRRDRTRTRLDLADLEADERDREDE